MKFKFHLALCCAGILFQTYFVCGQNEDLADRKSYLTKSQISAADKLRVFNNLWETVNRLYFDATFNGRDWSKLRQIYEPQALAAKDKIEFKIVLNKFISELNTSHLSVGWEIGISGKTLDKMFGRDADYKNNDILFGYGYTRINLGGQSVITEVIKNTSAEQLGVKPGWIEKSCESHSSSQQAGDNLIFSETADCVFSTENEAVKNLRLSQSWFYRREQKRSGSTKFYRVIFYT